MAVALEPRIRDARWVPAENLHATVAFLGDVPAPDAICRAVTSSVADLRPAPVRLEGLGAFPSARRARVVWAGITGEIEMLAEAAHRVAAALAPFGYEAEKRGFTPHVTLARLRTPGPIDLGAQSVRPVGFTVDGVGVYRSHLGRPAPRYERICFAPFAG